MCSIVFQQKFLINREGKVVERYASTTKPESIEAAVEAAAVTHR
jgi:glutathione peroxidase-family protein